MLANAALSYHTLLDLLAGGPGSGCRGPNCGRPRTNVKKTYQTAAGYSYTILKPSRRGIPKAQHSRKPRKVLHALPFNEKVLKGKFHPARLGNERINYRSKERYSDVYDAALPRGDKYEGHGITAFVDRDFKNMRVVVHIFPHDEMDKMGTGTKVYKFKNFGQAAGFLNKRYGIKQKLPKMSEEVK